VAGRLVTAPFLNTGGAFRDIEENEPLCSGSAEIDNRVVAFQITTQGGEMIGSLRDLSYEQIRWRCHSRKFC
jgi:hypothetical protein